MNNPSGDELVVMAEKITTKDEFVTFAHALVENYRLHREEWENDTLELFLSGLLGFSRDSERYYANRGEVLDLTQPSWRVMADTLLAARVYE